MGQSLVPGGLQRSAGRDVHRRWQRAWCAWLAWQDEGGTAPPISAEEKIDSPWY